jgi:two-component sensor histidine kinase
MFQKQNLISDDSWTIELVQKFVRLSSAADNFESVYLSFITVLENFLGIKNIAIYDIIPNEKKLISSVKNNLLVPKDKKEIVHFTDEIIGTVARTEISLLINSEEENYSILCVPIQSNGKLFGVISTSESNFNFFNIHHQKLFELIGEIAGSLLSRIIQKEELNQLKQTLEQHLESKKVALEVAIETVSNQFDELKQHRNRKEILLKEVHHRVNNNLQIISSLVSLYLNETQEPNFQTLKEIQSRIQILSTIHLILLKSFDTNEISLERFLEDLTAALRYNVQSNYLILNFSIKEVKTNFNFNTLIPLGMLLNELIQLSVEKHWKKDSTVEMDIEITTLFFGESYQIELIGKSPIDYTNTPQNEHVNHSIIESLCEQLEGDLEETIGESCKWKFTFQEI